MRKLLWIGDAACDSGFARCTHQTLEAFLAAGYDITVLGINHMGDPHSYPYPIYPCLPGGDLFGVNRTRELAEKVQPDIIVIQNDPWNVPAYLKQIEKAELTVKPLLVGAIAVDGKNCRGESLNGLDLAIFWTKFAETEAIEGGYQGITAVAPLGVDLAMYTPELQADSRRLIGLPETRLFDFIVGNVNRNQPRKRLDLTIQYFCEWLKETGRTEEGISLFLHVAPTGDTGYDVKQLMGYYGLKSKLLLSDPGAFRGWPEERLRHLYSSFDVQISTTQGEGWGLCTMEGMACGVPQIVPDWSALGEWARDAAFFVPCKGTITTPNNINSIGGVPDREAFISALDQMYQLKSLRDSYAVAGLSLVSRPEFRWKNIAATFLAAVEEVVAQKESGAEVLA